MSHRSVDSVMHRCRSSHRYLLASDLFNVGTYIHLRDNAAIEFHDAGVKSKLL